MTETAEETLAACGACGWVGTEDELRHPDEYANERASSYRGRNDELLGGREFCPSCNDSAQVWGKAEWDFEGGVINGQTWSEFVLEMSHG